MADQRPAGGITQNDRHRAATAALPIRIGRLRLPNTRSAGPLEEIASHHRQPHHQRRGADLAQIGAETGR